MSSESFVAARRADRLLARTARLIEAENVARPRRVLLKLLESPISNPARTKAQLQLARTAIVSGRLADARRTLHSFEPMHCDQEALQEALVLQAYCFALAGMPRVALKEVATVLRKRSAVDALTAEADLVVGMACFRSGHYKWATERFLRAAAYYRLVGQKARLAHALGDLALVYKNQGHHREALKYLDEATQLLGSRRLPRTRLGQLTNRGVCFLQLGELRKARTSFKSAESLASDTGNRYLHIGILNNLGHIYRMEGRLSEARICHERALVTAQSEGAQRKECLSLEYLGETALEEGFLEQALSYLNRAYSLARAISGRGDLVAGILRRRGEVYSALNRRAPALKDLHRARELCKARGQRRERVLVDRALMFLESEGPDELSVRARTVTREFESLRDRFELSRTVCLIVASGTLRPAGEKWLSLAVERAKRYYDSLEMWAWRDRLVEKPGLGEFDSEGEPTNDLASASPVFATALDEARIAARSAAPALILGETGVGKEVLARSIHRWSDRGDNRIVAVNCGAIPEALVENELFGHVRGAFTGAETKKQGLVETAHGGTLFLDEIGDVPPSVQLRLLRFLDNGEYRRVGDVETRRADVRVIAATNRNLRKLAADGLLRVDLLYRLSVFTIKVPPLRERPEDVIPLAEHFLYEASARTLRWSPDTKAHLLAYEWPGNIRELKNVCQYAAAKAVGRSVAARKDLPAHLVGSVDSDNLWTTRSIFDRERRELERSQIVRALKQTQGNISRAAGLLGMNRNRVARKIREYSIERPKARTTGRSR